jgi:hypothetical protein
MSDDFEFEVVESTRGMGKPHLSSTDKIIDAAADNFGAIIDLAKNIVDIQKMQIQSEAVLAKMAEDRKMLLATAEAYVMKKDADTKNVIDRMKMIQNLLRDFYVYNQNRETGLSGNEFSRIITELLAKTE